MLFYGSCLQRGVPEGMLDFYALVDDANGYDQTGLIAWLGDRLPPNVYPETFSDMRAKVAVVTVAEFQRRMAVERRDTTFWARFCQRACLAWTRDDAAERAAVDAVASAAETAALWSARLSPRAEGVAAWRGALRQNLPHRDQS